MKYAVQTDPNNNFPNPQCENVWRGRMTRLLRQCFCELLLRIMRRVRLMRQHNYSCNLLFSGQTVTAPVNFQSFERVSAHTSCSEICHARGSAAISRSTRGWCGSTPCICVNLNLVDSPPPEMAVLGRPFANRGKIRSSQRMQWTC